MPSCGSSTGPGRQEAGGGVEGVGGPVRGPAAPAGRDAIDAMITTRPYQLRRSLTWYNPHHRQSSLGYVSPAEYEHAHHENPPQTAVSAAL